MIFGFLVYTTCDEPMAMTDIVGATERRNLDSFQSLMWTQWLLLSSIASGTKPHIIFHVRALG